MTSRKALVVDDSRSARAFLTRILERYDLLVDGVESAEEAMSYLARQQPDVIFMDHLMPGMDGFQAVQAIKNNPRTATIPIMMYTSQEGELYLSQARALGAIGVLPKQIKPVDVTKTLDQLKLLGERRQETATRDISEAITGKFETVSAVSEPAGSPPGAQAPPTTPDAATGAVITAANERRAPDRPALPPMPPDMRAIMESMLTHHVRDLRRFVVDSLESHSDRIIGDVRLILQDQAEAQTPAGPLLRPLGSSRWLAGGLGALAVAALCASGVMLWQWSAKRDAVAALTAELGRAQQQAADAELSMRALQAADAAAAASAAAPATEAANERNSTALIEPVPFGETPLAGARLDRLSTLLARLNSEGFRGTVDIKLVPGRFCLVPGQGGAMTLASDATLYGKCELVGNPREADDFAGSTLNQSVAFANLLATSRSKSAGKMQIQVSAGTADDVVTPYPPLSELLTAGEWNHVAAANNRVEVHWQASH